jgi:hypothetical protein
MKTPSLRDRGLITSNLYTADDYVAVGTATPTAGGLTTGILPDNTKIVLVESSGNAAHYIDLPATFTTGTCIRLLMKATGCKLTSVQNAAAMTINGVSVRNKAATLAITAGG